MDDMLKVLMDMDAAARDRTNEVEAMKENNQSKLATQKAEIIEEKMKDAKLRADEKASQIAEETEKRIEEIKSKGQQSFSDMEKLADENRKTWVDEIVARTLNN